MFLVIHLPLVCPLDPAKDDALKGSGEGEDVWSGSMLLVASLW
jgi:hypothetical protein